MSVWLQCSVLSCTVANEGLALMDRPPQSLSMSVSLQCFVVSTLVSMTPANPFIFRNYELSPTSAERARQVSPSPLIPQQAT